MHLDYTYVIYSAFFAKNAYIYCEYVMKIIDNYLII
jgi:hypothetical protein